MTLSPAQILDHLSRLDIGTIRWNEPLSAHCSWKIGGKADVLVEPVRVEQIVNLIEFLADKPLPLLVIGQGTNLLFDDAGFRGVILKLGSGFSRIEIDGLFIRADAGLWVPQLARLAMRAGLTGLEHCIGIPGTLGGLVLMNGGSHRRSIGENLRRIEVVDSDGRRRVLDRSECEFSYRHSALQGRGCVIVRVELQCAAGTVNAIRQEMVCDLRERRHKFPRKCPNCGSVFLSTGEMHASVGPPGKIIEEAGLKGLRIGNAEVSRQHANFIVNAGGARSADVLALIAQIRRQVAGNIGFDLRCEVRYVHPDGKIMPADQAGV